MTNLETSPVTRRSGCTYMGKRVIVTLRKDDCIELRLERARQPLARIPIHDLCVHNTWSGYGIPPSSR